jgi:hypothetical protein
MEEKMSKSLKRYYDNRIKINERQKKYFREVYYWKNRQKLLDYQRIYRQTEQDIYPRNKLNYLMVENHVVKKKDNVIIEKNILVSF